MRIATPLVTCSSISDRSPCASPVLTSTPSFIGPGCISSAPGLACAIRPSFTCHRRMYSRRLGKKPRSCRSRCIRSAITKSAPAIAASKSGSIRTPASGFPPSRFPPKPSEPPAFPPEPPAPTAFPPSHPSAVSGYGISVGGPQSVTCAPTRANPHSAERATRLCSTSPTITTLRPASPPRCRRAVYKSSSPCVGCACAPSPALITATRGRFRASRCGAPACGCRITTASTPIACSVSPVFSSDSPFVTLLALPVILMTSALRIFPASSNEIRVRVLAS